MNPVLRRALLVVFILLFSPLFLAAQDTLDNDGVLGFSPRLVVKAETDPLTSSSLLPGIILHQYEYLSRSPLLPTIFFDDPGSTDIPPRYQQFDDSYRATLYTDQDWSAGSASVARYREILNIIGYRMRNAPAATIALEGYYSAEPGETKEVALRRADVVREYLTTTWNIEPERIAIVSARQSCDISAPLPAQEEGRCVRIRSDAREILAPVRIRSVAPRVDGFRLCFDLDPMMKAAEVVSVEMDVFFADSLVVTIAIAGDPDSAVYRPSIYWTPPKYFFCRPSMLSGDGIFEHPPLHIRARVRTIDGTVHNSNMASVPVESKRYGATVDQSLYLPFFDYREKDLSEVQRAWLDDVLEKSRSKGAHYRIVPAPDPSERFDVETHLGERDRMLEKNDEASRHGIIVRFVETDDEGRTPVRDFTQYTGKDPQNDSLATTRAKNIIKYIGKDFAEHADTLSTVVPGTIIWLGIFRYEDTPEERLYERKALIYRHDLDKLPKPARNANAGGDH